MKKKAGLNELIVSTQAILEDNSSLNEYKRDHFYVIAPHPSMASISGSTETNLHHTGEQQVLDASCLVYDEKANFAMATADGLGFSDDKNDNRNTAVMSAYCCEQYCLTNQKKSLIDIAKESVHTNQINFGDTAYDARTAIAALSYNANTQQLQMQLMGDTLTVIFDGQTGELKDQQKARVYNQGGSVWAPADLQLFAHPKPAVVDFASSALQTKQVKVNEGDIIVQMTDGIWSELPTADEQVDLADFSYIETGLNITNISQISSLVSENEIVNAPALDIATNIHDTVITKFRRNIALFCQLHPGVIDKLAEDANSPDKLMKTFVSELDDHSKQLFSQLFIEKSHDSVSYDDEMPVALFYHLYKRLNFGDCSTISVFKVPEKNELNLIFLLTHFNKLTRHIDLVNSLSQLSDDKRKSLFDKFKKFRVVESNKEPLKENSAQIGKLAFDINNLEKLEHFIHHYKTCEEMLDDVLPEAIKRERLLHYIKNIESIDDQKFLAQFYRYKNKSLMTELCNLFLFNPSAEGVSTKKYNQEIARLTK